MSSTQAAGFGVREAFSSLSRRRSPRAAVVPGVPDLLGERPLVACRVVGDVDDGFSERGHPQPGEQGHVIVGEVLVRRIVGLLPAPVSASRLNAEALAR